MSYLYGKFEMKRLFLVTMILVLTACGNADKIGEVSTKFNLFSSNDTIIVEAFDDPDILGMSCFLSRAKTGGVSGALGVAEDTSDAAISCVKIGEVKLPENVHTGKANGEKVFKKSTNVFFKSMQVVRSYDVDRGVLTYMVYSDKLIEGSPKNSISAVFVGK